MAASSAAEMAETMAACLDIEKVLTKAGQLADLSGCSTADEMVDKMVCPTVVPWATSTAVMWAQKTAGVMAGL